MKKAILAHCDVLFGQGKTKDEAYLILVEKYLDGNLCSECVMEIYNSFPHPL